MNNKGFTLTEILAVIFIIMILSLFAFTNHIKSLNNGKIKTFLNEVATISDGALNKYADDRLNKNFSNNLFQGTSTTKACYVFKSALKDEFVTKYSDDYVGSVEVCYGTDCDYKTKVWLTNGEYYINGKVTDLLLSKSDVDSQFTSDNYLTCGQSINNVKTEFDYDFTGLEQRFLAYTSGVYSIETWGAQGGSAGKYSGGYGGYAYTEMELTRGDMLYINVGGEGSPAGSPAPKGGYNGGGDGYDSNGSGGGGTSVALKSGFIKKPITNDYIIAVAGGGGGGKSYSTQCCHDPLRNGYNGGGFKDESGYVSQSGNVYGTATSRGGSGGGYFGSNHDHPDPGYGGSGYIGNPKTSNGVMYGYNVPESNSSTTYTISTTNVSEVPTPTYAKKGDGYAMIKLIGKYLIRYNLNGGTVSTPNRTYFNDTTETFTLNNPTKTYYDFVGWTGTGLSSPTMTVTIPKGSTGGRKYTATYTPTNYTITYNLNGGQLFNGETNPSSYNIETATFTLHNPYKEGYVFTGWTLNGDSTLLTTATIAKGNHGNRSYTANFTPTVEVKFDYNLGEYTFADGGAYLDTGYAVNFDKSFRFEQTIYLPAINKRYLLFGNYNQSNQFGLEITQYNNLRVWKNGDVSASPSNIQANKDISCTFLWIYELRAYNYNCTADGFETSTSAYMTGATGISPSPLRVNKDYRNDSGTFTPITLKDLKMSRFYVAGDTLSDIPASVTIPNKTFVGWFTSASGGTQITAESTVPNSSVTYYAHWE